METAEQISPDAIETNKRITAKQLKAKMRQMELAHEKVIQDVKAYAARVHRFYHAGSRFKLFVHSDWTNCNLSTCREAQRIAGLSPFK